MKPWDRQLATWAALARHSPVLWREHGFALIVVIWGLGLISLLALNFAVAINSQTKATANIIESTKAQVAADSGILLAGLRLSQPPGGQTGTRDSPGHEVLHIACRTPDGTRLLIAAEDEGGKIDLNAADDRLLQRLFITFGASEDKAAALVDAVVDFRDADDLRRVHGAEAPEYRAAGLIYGPKNARFDSIEELEQVIGMPQELYAAVRPFLTVYSRRTGIDPQFARPEVLAAAAGFDAVTAKAQVASGPDAWRSIQVPSEFVAPSSRRAFLVTALATSGGGAIFPRQAVLELIASSERPFVVRDWGRARIAGGTEPSLSSTLSFAAPATLPEC